MYKNLGSQIIFGKYKIQKLISKGTFSEVYLGKNIKNNKNYAIKIEDCKKEKTNLKEEAYILYSVKGPGIPELISFGRRGKYNILVQNLLGKSIYEIWLKKKKKFTLKDICMLGIQGLERLEYIHSKNYIHRDIKPGNFLVGNPDSSQIYLIDFGMAKKYRSSRTGKHVSFSKNYIIYGTPMFLSINSLKGLELIRRDDLESFGLILIYLYTGNLPWDKITAKDFKGLVKALREMRETLPIKTLCKGMPLEMNYYMEYIFKLKFEQDPDYRYLRSLFLNILQKIGEKNDFFFSWVDKKIEIKKLNSRSKSNSRQKLYARLFQNNNVSIQKLKSQETLPINQNNKHSTSLIPKPNDYIKKINQINLTEKNEKKNNISVEDLNMFKYGIQIYKQKKKNDNNIKKMENKFLSINPSKKNIIPNDDNKKRIKNNNNRIKNISNQKSVGLITPKAFKFIKYNFNPVNNIIINMEKREQLNSQNNSKPKDYPKKGRNYLKTYNSFNIDNSNLKDIKDTSSKLIFNKINNNETKAKNLPNRNNYLKIEENNKNSKRIIKEDTNFSVAGYKSIFCSYKNTISDFNRRLLNEGENNGDIFGDVHAYNRLNTLYEDNNRRNFLVSKNPNNLVYTYNSPLNSDNWRTLINSSKNELIFNYK